MATITRAAIQWMQDEMESKDALIAELEEELEDALEENLQLKAMLSRHMATRGEGH